MYNTVLRVYACIPRSVLHCVRKFDSDAALQTDGCQAIACLAMTEKNRSKMVAEGDAGALVFLALNKHRGDVAVQENACKAISYLVRDSMMTYCWVLCDTIMAFV